MHQARAARDVALAQIARTRAVIARKTISAPFRARVGLSDVHPGQYLREGTDLKYGARHLKRALERHLVYPLSNLIATGQIGMGDVIKIDLGASGDKLTYCKERVIPSFTVADSGNVAEFPNRRVSQAGAKLQAFESEAATCERLA